VSLEEEEEKLFLKKVKSADICHGFPSVLAPGTTRLSLVGLS